MSAVARTKPGPPFQELPNPLEAVSRSDAPWRSRKVWVRAHDACINATASGPPARTARRRTSFLTSVQPRQIVEQMLQRSDKSWEVKYGRGALAVEEQMLDIPPLQL